MNKLDSRRASVHQLVVAEVEHRADGKLVHLSLKTMRAQVVMGGGGNIGQNKPHLFLNNLKVGKPKVLT